MDEEDIICNWGYDARNLSTTEAVFSPYFCIVEIDNQVFNH